MRLSRPKNLTLFEPLTHDCKGPNNARGTCRTPGSCSKCSKRFPSCELWILIEHHPKMNDRFAFCEDCVPPMVDTRQLKGTDAL